MSLFTFGQNFGNILSNATNNQNSNDNEIIEVDQSDNEDDRDEDDSYDFRAKIPRLNSDPNIKESNKNDKENDDSNSNEEEVLFFLKNFIIRQIVIKNILRLVRFVLNLGLIQEFIVLFV